MFKLRKLMDISELIIVTRCYALDFSYFVYTSQNEDLTRGVILFSRCK